MNSLQVNFIESSRSIEKREDCNPEPWNEVCDRYDNDVHRVMDVPGHEGYSALYVCYDENNLPFYYLVEEDDALKRMRRKTLLKKLGKDSP